MKQFYLHWASTLAQRPYFKGRDRLTYFLLCRAAGYGPQRVQIEGLLFDLNLVDSFSQHLFLSQRFPGSVWRLLARLLDSGMVMLDIGANIGYTAMVAARRVGPAGRVFAFEPSPRAYASLTANLALNKLDWVQAEPAACGEVAADATLYVSSLSDEYCSLAQDGHGLLDKAVQCEVIQVDRYLSAQSIARVDVVKIDVEGAELFVLKGMKSLLTNDHPPLLIVEACLKNTSSFGYTPAEMFSWLAADGYHLSILAEDGLIPYDPKYVLRPDGYCDVVCAPPLWRQRVASVQRELEQVAARHNVERAAQ